MNAAFENLTKVLHKFRHLRALMLVFILHTMLVTPAQATGLFLSFKDEKNYVTFFASSHSATDGVIFEDQYYSAKVSDADVLVFEQEIDQVSVGQFLKAIAQSDRRLDSSAQELGKDALSAIGEKTNLSVLGTTRPMLLTFMFFNTLSRRGMTVRGSGSIESYFAQATRADKKGVFNLEKLSDFAKQINLLSNEEENALFVQAARFMRDQAPREKLKSWGENLPRLLRNGDCERFTSAYADMFLTDNLLRTAYEKYVFARNEKMADRLLQILSTPGKKRVAVVVGAAHLCGDSGLFAKLKAAGYIVTK
jgi:uncharacterized protein YbaP (TraB family)